LDGYVEYESRSFCKGIGCPVQLRLNAEWKGSPKYEKIRAECRDCMASRFHHWLDERGYVIVKPGGEA